MHIFISYPDDASEREVIRLVRKEAARDQLSVASGQSPVADGGEAEELKSIKQETVFKARDEIQEVKISEPMEDYIVALVAATRRPEEFGEELAKYIQIGVSPRGSIALDKCSRAYAWLQGRDTVTPDDIRAVINECLRHRPGQGVPLSCP